LFTKSPRRTEQRLFGLDLPQRERKALERLADEVTLPEGTVLMREGRFGREVFVLLEGEVEVRRDDEVIAVLGPGEVVGELAVLDPTQTRNATVVASTELRTLVLDPRAYRSLRYLPVLGRLLIRTDRYHAA
jgi:CRP-like cAMP-binding protein